MYSRQSLSKAETFDSRTHMYEKKLRSRFKMKRQSTSSNAFSYIKLMKQISFLLKRKQKQQQKQLQCLLVHLIYATDLRNDYIPHFLESMDTDQRECTLYGSRHTCFLFSVYGIDISGVSLPDIDYLISCLQLSNLDRAEYLRRSKRMQMLQCKSEILIPLCPQGNRLAFKFMKRFQQSSGVHIIE